MFFSREFRITFDTVVEYISLYITIGREIPYEYANSLVEDKLTTQCHQQHHYQQVYKTRHRELERLSNTKFTKSQGFDLFKSLEKHLYKIPLYLYHDYTSD